VAAREYSDAQRDALAAAFAQPSVTAKRVAEMAAAGELVDAEGQPFKEFSVPESTIRDFARQARLSEARGSALDDGSPRDAIEALRQRLIKLADAEMKVLEAQPQGKVDLERLRWVIRCVDDAAKIPRPPEPRPRSDERGEGTPRSPDATAPGVGSLITEHRRTLPAPTPEAQAVTPAPEQPQSRLMDRFHREVEERMERLRQGQAERAVQDVEPVAVPEPVRNGDRPRRRRRPEEDTSSCRW
jgi:hypothetical protein